MFPFVSIWRWMAVNCAIMSSDDDVRCRFQLYDACCSWRMVMPAAVKIDSIVAAAQDKNNRGLSTDWLHGLVLATVSFWRHHDHRRRRRVLFMVFKSVAVKLPSNIHFENSCSHSNIKYYYHCIDVHWRCCICVCR